MDISCLHCGRTFTVKLKYKTQKFCSLLCANRYNRNHSLAVVLPKLSHELAEFFGILLGDGGVTKYHTKIYLNAIVDEKYSNYVLSLVKKLFNGASISRRFLYHRGTVEIQISSTIVSNFLRLQGFERQRTIPSWINNNLQLQKACVRGLFDTEGSVGIKFFVGKTGKYLYKQLTFTNKNKNILSFVETVLKNLLFKPTLNSQKNIYISSKKDIKRFLSEIGSSNQKILDKIKKENKLGFKWTKG